MITLDQLLRQEGLTLVARHVQVDPVLTAGIAAFHQMMASWVTKGRRDGEPMRLLVELVDAPGFNAFAASVQEGDLIAIYRDLFPILHETARALVSHGLILPEVTSGVHVTPSDNLGDASLLALSSTPWVIGPLPDPLRDSVAFRIAQSALLYVLVHEFTHIYRGHLEYGVVTGGKAVRAELPIGGLPAPQGLADETIEWDADTLAIKLCLHVALKPRTWVEGGVERWEFGDTGVYGSPEQSVQIATLGPILCSLIFDAAEEGDWIENEPRSHPHAAHRYATVVMLVGHIIEHAEGGPVDKLRSSTSEGNEAIQQSWRRTFGRRRRARASNDVAAFSAAHRERVQGYLQTWSEMRDELSKHHRGGGLSWNVGDEPSSKDDR